MSRVFLSRKIRDKHRAQRLKATYNLALEQYEAMLNGQEGRCAICRDLPPPGKLLAVDHCHKTGKVRGLLCFLCNTGLGSFRDNEEFLREAVEYLEIADTITAGDEWKTERF